MRNAMCMSAYQFLGIIFQCNKTCFLLMQDSADDFAEEKFERKSFFNALEFLFLKLL